MYGPFYCCMSMAVLPSLGMVSLLDSCADEATGLRSTPSPTLLYLRVEYDIVKQGWLTQNLAYMQTSLELYNITSSPP